MSQLIRVVQFDSPLEEGEYKLVARALRKYPHVQLSAYASYDGAIKNLDFLKHFPKLRAGFNAGRLPYLADISGLKYLPADLFYLSLGQPLKPLSLAPLARFTGLKRLHLDGQAKDAEVLSEMTSLVHLILRSLTLPNLESLTPLTQLRALEIKLGGTKDLAALPEIGRLEYLEIWRVRGLTDLSPIAGLPHLECLFLQQLRRVEVLPEMHRMVGLRRFWLEALKGLTDLSPIATAPRLEDLAVVDMPHLVPQDLTSLVGIPTLRNVRIGLGSVRRNRAASQLFNLPDNGDWAKPRLP